MAPADGRGARCLTCLPRDFRKRHAGAAAWHPSGDYLFFRVERPVREADRPLPFLDVPGGNRGEDLWAITADGKSFWRLTGRGEEKGARFTPLVVSREGGRAAWSERLASARGLWGEWALQVARLRVSRGLPRLKKSRAVRPGGETLFVEACDFRPDDRALLFAGSLSAAEPEAGLDLFVYDLEEGLVERLTSSAGAWDRWGRYSPDGQWIVWVSNRDLGPGAGRSGPAARAASTEVASDLWLMRSDGRGAERLTRFNDVLSDQYMGRVAVGPPAWSPEGDALLVSVAPLGEPAAATLYRLDLGPPPAPR